MYLPQHPTQYHQVGPPQAFAKQEGRFMQPHSYYRPEISHAESFEGYSTNASSYSQPQNNNLYGSQFASSPAFIQFSHGNQSLSSQCIRQVPNSVSRIESAYPYGQNYTMRDDMIQRQYPNREQIQIRNNVPTISYIPQIQSQPIQYETHMNYQYSIRSQPTYSQNIHLREFSPVQNEEQQRISSVSPQRTDIYQNYSDEEIIISKEPTIIFDERKQPPPPSVPSQRVLTPSVPVISWHPLRVTSNERQKQQNEGNEQSNRQKQRMEDNEETNSQYNKSNFKEKEDNQSNQKAQNKSKIQLKNLWNKNKEQSVNNLQGLKSRVKELDSYEDDGDGSGENDENDSKNLKNSNVIKSILKKTSYHNSDSDEEDEVVDERAKRFLDLFEFEKINSQHENLFDKDFKNDKKMNELFGKNKKIQRFQLGGKSVPSIIWRDDDGNEFREDKEKEYDEYEEYEETTTTKMRNQLWDVRYHLIGEYDSLISINSNMFARKSNYLRLGIFYKQALLRHQFDKKKEIVNYMYSYDEYSVKKKQSEIDEDNQKQKNSSFQYLEEQFDANNSPEIPNLENLKNQSSSKNNLSPTKSIIWNANNKQKVLNSMNQQMKSKVITITTVNKSQTIKTKVNDVFNFEKSSFLRDYEKTFQKEIEEDLSKQQQNSSSRSNLSGDKMISTMTEISDNYSKLFKAKPAKERKKVITKKDDDLSKIKKHNKFLLWEKNAVSEDAFLDQVRDQTIEAVKRSRNLEEIIVEKNSVFEHHAASLLNQHLFEMRKVTREYKAELYMKVKEIIQNIYNEYREIVNFESNNTFVMLVCDKNDEDRILGLHYHGYQSRKYFEKYFDEFVTYKMTRLEFETKRYQAYLLDKDESKICSRYFLK